MTNSFRWCGTARNVSADAAWQILLMLRVNCGCAEKPLEQSVVQFVHDARTALFNSSSVGTLPQIVRGWVTLSNISAASSIHPPSKNNGERSGVRSLQGADKSAHGSRVLCFFPMRLDRQLESEEWPASADRVYRRLDPIDHQTRQFVRAPVRPASLFETDRRTFRHGHRKWKRPPADDRRHTSRTPL